MEGEVSVLENIKESYDMLFVAEKKVADYIVENANKVIMMNVSQLATESGVSDATVVRMCKHLGYKGYYQMRLILSRDFGNNARALEDKKPIDSLQSLFNQLANSILDVSKNIDLPTMMLCVNVLKSSKTVYIAAAGNTTPLSMDLGFRLGRYEIRTVFSNIPEYLLNLLSLGTSEDALIVVTQSGTSKHVVQAAEVASDLGMKIIAITATAQSPISKLATHILFSTTNRNIFEWHEPGNHLCEMAICDALVYFVKNGEAICKHNAQLAKDEHNKQIDFLLSEFQL